MHASISVESISLRAREGGANWVVKDIVHVVAVHLRHHDEQDVEVDVSQEDDEDTMLIHKSLFRVDEGLWRETVLRLSKARNTHNQVGLVLHQRDQQEEQNRSECLCGTKIVCGLRSMSWE